MTEYPYFDEDVVVISGGMDPVHGGHIDYITQAAKYGVVVLLLNSDEWLKRKKGYIFMKWPERQKILMAMENIKSVHSVNDEDDTVVKGLTFIRWLYPDKKIYFAKGGDRGPDNTPEAEWCDHLGIEMLYGIGGEKTQSSSELIRGVSEVLAH